MMRPSSSPHPYYRAVDFGRSVKEAFELGKAALLLEGIPEDKTPELLTRTGVDAAELRLITPPAAARPGAEVPAAQGPAGPLAGLARLSLVRGPSAPGPPDWATMV